MPPQPTIGVLDPHLVIEEELRAVSAAVMRPDPVLPRTPAVPLMALAATVSPPTPATITIDSVSPLATNVDTAFVLANTDYSGLEMRIFEHLNRAISAAADPNAGVTLWNAFALSPSLHDVVVAEARNVARKQIEALPTVWQRLMEPDLV